MKNASLITAAAIVIIANAFALVHAALNRTGPPEAEIVLTERELRHWAPSPKDEDSGVDLHLQWVQLSIDEANPTPDSQRDYQRRRARRAFVALEFDGDAWHAWAESHRAAASTSSHLVATDADTDAGRLRARHPDRTRVIILPVALLFNQHQKLASSRGIRDVPDTIHVPLPFSNRFRPASPTYRVHLRYGSALEPWITGIDMP